jgi:4-alpha-glucanotransferase
VGDRGQIDEDYLDFAGRRQRVPPETIAAVRAAMGPPPDGPYGDVVVWSAGSPWTRPGELRLEDGTAWKGGLLPLGYHDFLPHGARLPVRVIVTPGQCHLPEDLFGWGWAVQLYATRSKSSWGIGDLADLRRLGRWSRSLGARVVLVNPLVAATPVLPIEASPYYPSSRRFRNPVYLRVGGHPPPSSGRRIDRDAIFAAKMKLLAEEFTRFGGAPAFERYRREQGEALERFAAFCAIAEVHGRDWRRWPQPLRRPETSAVKEYAASPRAQLHAWLQWRLDEQLGEAAQEIGIVQDLPIGLDAAGADAWCWQELLAQGASVGAPPDEFNPAGQDWGLTPFVPDRLRAAGYGPLVETLRATFRHAAGLRIDHVMGLFRLYWVAGGAGAYVRTHAPEILGIVALESARARAFVVGEDLGTVEPGVREAMAAHRMLSYRLLYFEEGPPATFPEMALTSVTTHDLPTVAGLWSGADLRRSQAAGVPQNEEGLLALRQKLGAGQDAEAVVAATHRALAQAPSRLVLATLEDALAVEERPNLPGAPADFPNWSLALPVPIEELEEKPLPRVIAAALNGRARLEPAAKTSPRSGHPIDSK